MKRKAIGIAAFIGLALTGIVAASADQATKSAGSSQSPKTCQWRFQSVPEGYIACKITRASPGSGVTEVNVFVCSNGKMKSNGLAAPSKSTCPNGWES